MCDSTCTSRQVLALTYPVNGVKRPFLASPSTTIGVVDALLGCFVLFVVSNLMFLRSGVRNISDESFFRTTRAVANTAEWRTGGV